MSWHSNSPKRERFDGPSTRPSPARPDGEADLRELVGRLGRDASQLAHDEITLARLELRSIADTMTTELRDAARTVATNLAKIGVALVFAMLAGFAITAGAILAIGSLLGGAYWAGGLIVGVVWLVVAAVLGAGAARDLRKPDSPLRMEETRRAAEHGSDVLNSEAQETKHFVQDEGREFKRRATPPEKPPEVH
ncbi:MAG TPA: phage holin family protein [Longimicrobiales bacterium]|nr:phage holin family protein [Longimicrobiales bacterium]